MNLPSARSTFARLASRGLLYCNLHIGRANVSLRFYRKGKTTHFDVLDKRGRLHVLRQPSPWSLTASSGERLKDLMESLLPWRFSDGGLASARSID
jgi:hypothetical protein